MTALTFTLKQNSVIKINCGRLTPNYLAGLSITQIKNLNPLNTKNSAKVTDFFDVSGDNSEHIIFKNSNNQLDYIGHKMSHGHIIIESDCGDFLGAQMQGGTIVCTGSAGDRVADQMRRGLILIDENAGDYCGSTIGVYGSIGKYAGFGMKRGTLLLKNQPNLHATIQDCGIHILPFLALLFQSFGILPSKFSSIKSQRVQRFAGDLACDGNGEILVLM
jgi:formylmethanofuran dehydrogenase subunit C